MQSNKITMIIAHLKMTRKSADADAAPTNPASIATSNAVTASATQHPKTK